MKSKLTSWISKGLLGVGLLGFVDATFLTIEHFGGTELACGITGGCDVVTTSAYSEIFGIPVALLGALYYLTMIVLMIAYMDRGKELLLRGASWLTITGLAASIYFTSIQAFVLEAWCQYCIGSAITSTLLFILGMTYLVKRER